MAEIVARRGQTFKVGLLNPRDGLTDEDVRASFASVALQTQAGDDAGGPYPAVYNAVVQGWVALCPPRSEAVGTILTTIESVTVGGIVYESRGTLRVTA